MDKDTMKLLLEQLAKGMSDTQSDIKEILREVAEVKNTQVKQEAVLEEHIRRTEANERHLELAKSESDRRFTVMAEEMKPLKTHVAMWGGAGKVVTILGVLAGIIGAAIKFLM